MKEKKKIILSFVILLALLPLISSYTAPSFDNVTFILEGDYTAPSFDNVTFILSDVEINQAPKITLNFPDDNNLSQSSTIIFNATVTDDNNLLTNVSLYGNFTGSWALNETNSSGIGGDYLFTRVLPEGTYLWAIYACDNSSNCRWSANRTIGIDLNDPITTIDYPTAINYTTKPTTFNITSSDTYLDSCWYSLDNGSTNVSYTCNVDITGLSADEEWNTWTAYVNDSSGRESSDLVTFYVDSISPVINITYPLNATYNGTVTQLNYTYIEINPGFCWYSLDGGTTNSSAISVGTNFTGLASSEGQNNWTLYCNDSFGNEAKDEEFFFVDSVYPLIEYTTGTDANDSTSFNDWIFVNVTVVELNEVNITFYLYNDSGLLESRDFTNQTRSVNFTGLTEDDYYFNVTIVDIANNKNSTETRKVMIRQLLEFNISITPGTQFYFYPANGTDQQVEPVNQTYHDFSLLNFDALDGFNSPTGELSSIIKKEGNYSLNTTTGRTIYNQIFTWNGDALDVSIHANSSNELGNSYLSFWAYIENCSLTVLSNGKCTINNFEFGNENAVNQTNWNVADYGHNFTSGEWEYITLNFNESSYRNIETIDWSEVDYIETYLINNSIIQTRVYIDDLRIHSPVGIFTANNNLSNDIVIWAKLNVTNSDITLLIGNSSNYSLSVSITDSYQEIHNNLSVNSTIYLWAWADYNDPKQPWYPELSIVGVSL